MLEEEKTRFQADIDELINDAGARLSNEMRRAMAQGEVEFKDMAERIALDMSKMILKQILSGIQTQNLGNGTSNNGVQTGQFAQLLTSLVQQGSRFS